MAYIRGYCWIWLDGATSLGTLNPAMADELELYAGLGALINDSILEGEPTDIDPIPLIALEKGRLSFSTLDGIGFRLLKTSRASLELNLEYEALDFDSDNRALESIEEPNSIAALSLAYQRNYAFSYLRTEIGRDVSGNHNGWQAMLTLGVEFPLGKGELEANLSAQYQTSEWVNHFYGVSADDSTDAVAAYRAGKSINYQTVWFYEYPLNSRWIWLNGLLYTQLGEGVRRSSIVEESASLTAFSAVVYRF